MKCEVVMKENKPDYEFDAYLKCDDMPSVLCDVALWLPKDADDDVQVRLDSPEELQLIQGFMRKSVNFESEIYQENPIFSAKLSNARIRELTRQLDKRKLSRTKIELLHVDELTLVNKHGSGSNKNLPKTIYFSISKIDYAKPDACIVPDYLGNRKVEVNKNYSAKNSSGQEFRLERHYSEYVKISSSKEIVGSQAIIAFTALPELKSEEIDNVYNKVKDFSLLLTFAARYQVSVLGYEYWTENERVRFFKNPTDRYRASQEEVAKNVLIPLDSFEQFMNSALSKWDSFDNPTRLVIRDAIYAIYPFDRSGRQDFLAMFSAFEGIVGLIESGAVSDIKKNKSNLQSNYAEFVANQNLPEDTKEFLLEDFKFIENREKLRNKVSNCLDSLKIGTDDLWPIFEGVSLNKIRNWLAHGSRMELDSSYLIAQESLQFLLERIVLTLLGFDYNKSTSGSGLMGEWHKYNKAEIEVLQGKLKKILK